jgi:hypothetical protein
MPHKQGDLEEAKCQGKQEMAVDGNGPEQGKNKPQTAKSLSKVVKAAGAEIDGLFDSLKAKNKMDGKGNLTIALTPPSLATLTTLHLTRTLRLTLIL